MSLPVGVLLASESTSGRVPVAEGIHRHSSGCRPTGWDAVPGASGPPILPLSTWSSASSLSASGNGFRITVSDLSTPWGPVHSRYAPAIARYRLQAETGQGTPGGWGACFADAVHISVWRRVVESPLFVCYLRSHPADVDFTQPPPTAGRASRTNYWSHRRLAVTPVHASAHSRRPICLLDSTTARATASSTNKQWARAERHCRREPRSV